MPDHPLNQEAKEPVPVNRHSDAATLVIDYHDYVDISTAPRPTAKLCSDVTKTPLPRIVSLFSGAGGLDLGFRQNNYEIVYAVDKDRWAVETHRTAFPETHCDQFDLTKVPLEEIIKAIGRQLHPGERIGVIGGPPCQGFSRSNAQSKANDPRNRLPLLYLKIVQALKRSYSVEFIVFENVLGIQDKKHHRTFEGILHALQTLGLHETVNDYDAYDFGVPQHRHRIIIAAFQSSKALRAFAPRLEVSACKTVREAISDLPDPTFCSRSKHILNSFHPNHWTMRPLSARFGDPQNFTNSGRSFRILEWDKPSPTVAYGHREIHVHPNGKRRLSIYEAMLLQGFPKNFRLFGPFSAQVEQVSNAVPPPLALSLAKAIERSLKESRQWTSK